MAAGLLVFAKERSREAGVLGVGERDILSPKPSAQSVWYSSAPPEAFLAYRLRGSEASGHLR